MTTQFGPSTHSSGTEDRFTTLAAGRVQRHMQVLACVHQRRLARLLEQSVCLLVAEFERLLHRRHFLLGRVAQRDPEQRVVGEPLDCSGSSFSRLDACSSKRKTVSIYC